MTPSQHKGIGLLGAMGVSLGLWWLIILAGVAAWERAHHPDDVAPPVLEQR